MTSIMERAVSRAEELGQLGKFLLERLDLKDDVGFFDGADYSAQLAYLAQKQQNVRDLFSGVRFAAASVLLCEVPTQINSVRGLPLALAAAALKHLTLPRPLPVRKNALMSKDFFKVKHGGVAVVKTNIYFKDALVALGDVSLACRDRLMNLSGYLVGMYNDQATAVVMASAAMQPFLGVSAVDLSIRMVLDPVGCKSLTTVIKSLGLNSTPTGAMLCEAQCLQGRGVGEVDIVKECRERCKPVNEQSGVVQLDLQELKKAINKILDDELPGGKVDLGTLDDYWRSRWQWTVNGSHNRAAERDNGDVVVQYAGRVHRRVAAECWKSNIVEKWKGDVVVTPSVKLEHGKSRLLLAGDTQSYMSFNYLLKPVEKAWRGRRILLNPGEGGTAAVISRVRRLANPVKMMLDYDDFNSQHSLDAQALVIECVCDRTNVSDDLRKKLIDSFWRMKIHGPDGTIGYARATLMSGHRATSFINSILNAAYIMTSAPALWEKYESLHTGDDVVAAMRSHADAAELLSELKKTQLRMNPMKQSVGTKCSEFLRMAITAEETRGYIMRSISSAISGNWTNSHSMDMEERLQSYISTARTLCNRAPGVEMWRFLLPPLLSCVGCAKTTATSLLSGEAGLNDGPAFCLGTVRKQINIKFQKIVTKEGRAAEARYKEILRQVPSFATADYLTYRVSVVERRVLERIGLSPVSKMLESSYGKTLAEAGDGVRPPESYSITKKTSRMSRSCPLEDCLALRVRVGVLSKYPLLVMHKNVLNNADLCFVLKELGIAPEADLRAQCWGSYNTGNNVSGFVTYSDAASCRQRMGGAVIWPKTPYYL